MSYSLIVGEPIYS